MSAEQHISPQDYELLSAHIDGELTDAERITLEQRLTTEPTLQRELSSLRNTVNLIHQLQPMTAPRNFTLTADMVTPKNVIQLQPRRRRVRPDYLSLVASVLLMLFGVMFMLSELSQSAAPQTSAPVPQPAEAQIQDVEAPAVANAPTDAVDESAPVGRAVEDADVQTAEGGAGDAEHVQAEDEASTEKIETDSTKLPSPLLNQTLADDNGASPELRLESDIDADDSFGGEGFAGADSEQPMEFVVEEADDGTTDTTASSDTQLLDSVADEDMAEAEEPVAAGAIMMQTSAVSDTTTEADAITTGDMPDANDDAREDSNPEIASQVSNLEETHTLATPTDVPPPAEPPVQPPSPPITGLEVGLGLLSVGLILMMASLMIIRRNRS